MFQLSMKFPSFRLALKLFDAQNTRGIPQIWEPSRSYTRFTSGGSHLPLMGLAISTYFLRLVIFASAKYVVYGTVDDEEDNQL